MDRRRFVAAGGAALTAAAGGAPAAANVEKDGSNTRPGHLPIELRLQRGVLIPTRLFIIDQTSLEAFGVDFRNKLFRARNEDRANVLNPTIDKTFRGADREGEVRLWGSSLLATAAAPPSGQTLLLNGATAWVISRMQQIDLESSQLPVLGDIPILGHLFRARKGRERGNLLIQVTPTIHDDAL